MQLFQPSSSQRHTATLVARQIVLGSIVFGLIVLGSIGLLAACSASSDDPVSAGAGRDAPVTDNGSDIGGGDDAGAADLGQSDGSEPDPEPDSGPVDRVLREGVEGTITLITDGDTVHVTVNGWYHRVRVQGINAPECDKTLSNTADGRQYICTSDDEYWGLAAAEALEERALGSTVTVYCDQAVGQPCPIDTFDRPLAFLEDDQGDLGGWMARNGHAFSFTKFSSSRRAEYCEAEDLAIAENLGMWALGDVSDVLDEMSEGTRDWYEDRDRRCAEAAR